MVGRKNWWELAVEQLPPSPNGNLVLRGQGALETSAFVCGMDSGHHDHVLGGPGSSQIARWKAPPPFDFKATLKLQQQQQEGSCCDLTVVASTYFPTR